MKKEFVSVSFTTSTRQSSSSNSRRRALYHTCLSQNILHVAAGVVSPTGRLDSNASSKQVSASIALAPFPVRRLLLDLQAFDSRTQLAEDLVSLLVEFQLGGNQIRDIAERLGCVEDLFHLLVSTITSHYL